MEQINNGFKDYYYLTIDGYVFNKKTGKYLKSENNNVYRLVTIDGQPKGISRKNLYRLVYNKDLCIDNIENLDNEQWKAIPQTNNKYLVSNKGRVKSLQGYEAQLLYPIDKDNKYDRVDIRINGNKTRQLVHRLVALCFIDEENTIGKQLHHKDRNKKNNCVDNLIWVTPKEHKEIHKKMKEQENNK